MARGKEGQKLKGRPKTMFKVAIVSPFLSVITLNDIKNLDLFLGCEDICLDFLLETLLFLAFKFKSVTQPINFCIWCEVAVELHFFSIWISTC